MSLSNTWQNFQEAFFCDPETGLSMDLSRMGMTAEFFEKMSAPMEKAFKSMAELESGAIANPDEKRMVGHYWLRNSQLAPNEEIRQEIDDTIAKILDFSVKIRDGFIRPEKAERFTHILSIGIGGSALGPEFVASALASANPLLKIHFFDNTDPDGIDRVLAEIGGDIHRTLTIVISKSGGTKETRNGMLEAIDAYDHAGLHFARHAVAITGANSQLEQTAKMQQWLEIFPMWDWVGGRTSELSAVGLLPAALQGIDIEELLNGAAVIDVMTRRQQVKENPAALLALAWYWASSGQGSKDMVVLPYCDRLMLFSRYLQQLIMESLGKDKDLDGHSVHQGLTVYGNKGSTDQHAYVQQLRDGVHNFYDTFIVALKNRFRSSIEVDEDVVTGDYLSGFWQGTRQALSESGRQNLAIFIPEVSAFSVGMLIALYERAVGLYASLININAYHQPGVEAGKKAAGKILDMQQKLVKALTSNPKCQFSSEDLAKYIGAEEQVEAVFHIARHLAANNRFCIVATSWRPEAKFYQDPKLS